MLVDCTQSFITFCCEPFGIDGLLEYTQSVWDVMILKLAQNILVLCFNMICVINLKGSLSWRKDGNYGHVEECGFDAQE